LWRWLRRFDSRAPKASEMMNDHSAAAGQAELPRSAYLDHTLRRAWNAAQQRSHRYVTLEHLLLALVDDPDAAELLQAVDADISIIQSSVSTAINNNSALVGANGTSPAFSYKFDNLFAGAFKHASSVGRREIDGAFVLVAIAKHPDTDAAAILSANGFNAQVAQRTLNAALGAATQEPAAAVPPPPPNPTGPGGKQAKPKPKPKAEPQHAAKLHPAAAEAEAKAAAAQSGGGTGDRFMEDMLASVRSILDAENRKDWALAPMLNPAATQPNATPKREQARPAPQGRSETAGPEQNAPSPLPPLGLQLPPTMQQAPAPQHHPAPQQPGPALQRPAMAPPPPPAPPPPAPPSALAAQHSPAPPPHAPIHQRPGPPPPLQRPAAPGLAQPPQPGGPPPRLEPPALRSGIAQHALQQPSLAPQPGFSEPAAPSFDLEAPAPAPVLDRPQEQAQQREKPQQKRRKGANAKDRRAPKEPPSAFAKALENIPRRLRLARGEIVEIQLSKEEAATLFPRPQQAGDAVRAVTVRLSAPEGGFFIETLTPETQWLAARPGPASEEPFGAWSWALIPNETGTHSLAVSMLVRDVNANGELTGSQTAEQAVEIRVRANFGRQLWGFIRTLFLVGVGAGLAVGAWYALKATGHTPV
jgi:neural Wiskott-Aldrich syndrome protein